MVDLNGGYHRELLFSAGRAASTGSDWLTRAAARGHLNHDTLAVLQKKDNR